MSTKWTNSLQKVYYMYLCEIIRNSTMYKKHKKTQNTDPAFNSYLLLNGLKKNEKKKDLLLRVDTHWNIKMLRIHSTSIYTI